jgi:hypothetical protein
LTSTHQKLINTKKINFKQKNIFKLFKNIISTMFPAKTNLNIYTLSLEEIDGKKLENVTKKNIEKKNSGRSFELPK